MAPADQATWAGLEGGIPPSIAFIAAAPDGPATYRAYLLDKGYSVSDSTGVPEAVATAHARCPDLVFLDLGESPGTGLEMLRELKFDTCLGAIPLVILASFDRMDDIRSALEMGACDYIVKAETSAWALARGVPTWAGTDARLHHGLRESAAKTAYRARRWASGPELGSEPRVLGLPMPLTLPQP